MLKWLVPAGITLFLASLIAFSVGFWPRESQQDIERRAETRRIMKAEFMQGCNPDGQETRYCSCAFDELWDAHGPEGVVRVGAEYERTNRISEEMIDAAVQCL